MGCIHTFIRSRRSLNEITWQQQSIAVLQEQMAKASSYEDPVFTECLAKAKALRALIRKHETTFDDPILLSATGKPLRDQCEVVIKDLEDNGVRVQQED